MSRRPPTRGRVERWLPVAMAAVVLAVYLLTLAPGLTFENYGTDGGDLVTAAYTLGVPHPPGYPTYTLLAWLFTRLPLGSIAYRVNLLSATCAALTVGLCCSLVLRLLPDEPQRPFLAATAALSLAFGPLFWSQAVIAEVYALLALFAALLLWLLILWEQTSRDGLLLLAAFVLGLGLGNHLTLVFVAPAFLVWAWPLRQRWLRLRVLLPAAALFLVGSSVYAYLPLAAMHNSPVNWGNPQTWDRFLWVVTAEQYQSFVFGLPLADVPVRLSAWSWMFGEQFGWWGLGLVLVGAWSWGRRDRRFLLLSLIWALPLTIYAFFYNTADARTNLLPLLLLLALWWAEGARYLVNYAQQVRAGWRRVALAVVVVLPLVSLGLNWSAVDLSDERSVQTYTNQVLEQAAPDSLIVVREDGPTFALWYAVYAEGQRPDVAVVSGPLLAYIWYRDHVQQMYPTIDIPQPWSYDLTIDDLTRELIGRNLQSRPVYATDPREPWPTWYDFDQVDDLELYRVSPRSP